MAESQLSKRRFLARVAITHTVAWIGVLFFAWRIARFLIPTESLFWMGLGIMETAEGLFVLSVVILPLVAWLHARLYWRRQLSLAMHLGLGSAASSLIWLIGDLALRRIYFVPSPFPNPSLVPAGFSLVLAGVIGGIASGLTWSFAVRLMRTHDAEILRRFD
jgi:hypothetical protein